MTDAEYAKQKKRLEKLFDRWYKALGLGWWRLHISYYREGGPGFDAPAGSTWPSLATCTPDWEHKTAQVNWNMPGVADTDDKYLEEAFVHEIMHLFVSEMRTGKADGFDILPHEERVCTQLAQAFLWARAAGRADGRKK